MFVVVQEIQLKKPQKSGEYREYEVSSTTITDVLKGTSRTYYSYYPAWDKGQFERPIQTAYKITIHKSYRENGKVKKKQCSIGTISYYSLVLWGLFDYIDRGVNKAAEMFGEDYNEIYQMVENKMEPIKKKAVREFHKTEEYKATRERKKIQQKYQKAKAAFAKKYFVDEREYDACYNVYGEVMNQAYLDEIIQNASFYRSYRGYGRSNYNASGGYYNSQSGNYGNFSGQSSYSDFSGYSKTKCSTYDDSEKATLKKFYKTLSLKYHPDVNPDVDTTQEMQLLNKLKDEWGL